MKNYCKNCGLELTDDVDVCPSCGYQVETSEGEYFDDDVNIDNEKIINELNDKYLRLVAEFDNYKKRVVKERASLMETCNDTMVLDLLETIENFERAIKTEEINPGIKAIYSNFLSFLDKHNIKVIECIGKPFDVDTMEAVTSIERKDISTPNIVVDVISNGYMKNNRVIKFAKVVVSK